ncbi:hypothetical protein K8352_04460 [Flavobacteriaceae bacterium F89]|uniref:HMA domain-containing protein n=1 Tax=Cerina litoralis TaxID=2874477 RepID=A0AAE3ERQ1_9FLAO|nr:hypothetical protein [Cerina litoralis]MCG2459987.1 hypothetical protein [Cerina litoralis]
MKALVTLKNLKCNKGKGKIIRNLSRILDVRIVDINVDNGTMFFVYANVTAFQKVKRELFRIGYPMQTPNYPKAMAPKIYGGGRSSEISAV